jgi:Ca2+/H+ antiporter, TMEM165/GDT1 family
LQYAAVLGIAFALTFLAELPDKSMFASLVLSTRYRAAWVWAGSAAAFTVQMAIAVTAGQLLTLLPHLVLDGVVAGLFLAGSAYLWWSSIRADTNPKTGPSGPTGTHRSFAAVAGTSFAVVFLAEFGDITQVTAVNLAARFNPVLVFAGATLALWAVSAVAVTVGAKSLDFIPDRWVRRITAAILLGLGIYVAIAAATG